MRIKQINYFYFANDRTKTQITRVKINQIELREPLEI